MKYRIVQEEVDGGKLAYSAERSKDGEHWIYVSGTISFKTGREAEENLRRVLNPVKVVLKELEL